MNQDYAIALLRTLLQMAGAAITANGLATGEQWSAISGGVLAAASVIWMVWARYNTKVVATPAAPTAPRLSAHAWLGLPLVAALVLSGALGGCASVGAAVESSDAALARLSKGSLPAACAIVAVAQGYFETLAPKISATNHARYAAASALAGRVCADRPADTASALVTLAGAWADIQAATKAR
jgi:hypothetical protein